MLAKSNLVPPAERALLFAATVLPFFARGHHEVCCLGAWYEILERYLQAVRTYLPMSQQEDILKELRENLRGQIETGSPHSAAR